MLDESDKLFELGLVKQVDSVVKACSNPSILRSLFSATLPDTVEDLARTIMHDAVRVIIGRKWVLVSLVEKSLNDFFPSFSGVKGLISNTCFYQLK